MLWCMHAGVGGAVFSNHPPGPQPMSFAGDESHQGPRREKLPFRMHGATQCSLTQSIPAAGY
jgi:hypothetical protein